jgi:predicted  nucleic acid-binding Zn-ribbon protein
MEQLAAQIDKVNTNIDAIEELLKKPFRSWSEEEINLYGTEEHQARKQLRKKEEQLRKEKEQLRNKEEQLRKEKEQLREQETILLRIREKSYVSDIQGMKFL